MITVTVDLSKATREERESYLTSPLRSLLLSHSPYPVPHPKDFDGSNFFTVLTIDPPFSGKTNDFIFSKKTEDDGC